MKIEILLTDLSRKTEVLTCLAKCPGVRAAAGEVSIPGLALEVGEGYLLFTITNWERAEEIVPLLFAVQPAHSAYTFRPETGQKAVVTCRAKPLLDIIPELVSVEHLDLEAGELSGAFQVTWRSHDVAVTAEARLAVQGRVAVAGVKFTTHARDTEYHCRALVDMISCREILAVFCGEPLAAPVRPLAGPVLVEGTVQVPGDRWPDFFNSREWSGVTYDRGELQAALGPGSTVTFREGPEKSTQVVVRLADPGLLSDNLAAGLAGLGLSELRISRRISGAVLDLDRLRREMSFRAGPGLARFSRDGDFVTAYDARRLEVTMEAALALEDPPVQEKAVRLGRAMEELTARVMACAV